MFSYSFFLAVKIPDDPNMYPFSIVFTYIMSLGIFDWLLSQVILKKLRARDQYSDGVKPRPYGIFRLSYDIAVWIFVFCTAMIYNAWSFCVVSVLVGGFLIWYLFCVLSTRLYYENEDLILISVFKKQTISPSQIYKIKWERQNKSLGWKLVIHLYGKTTISFSEKYFVGLKKLGEKGQENGLREP